MTERETICIKCKATLWYAGWGNKHNSNTPWITKKVNKDGFWGYCHVGRVGGGPLHEPMDEVEYQFMTATHLIPPEVKHGS